MLDRQCLGNILYFMTFLGFLLQFIRFVESGPPVGHPKKIDILNGDIAQRTNAIF